MELSFYNNEDKVVVRNFCIEFIENNGYIRVGYAANNAVTGKKFESSKHRAAFINSVSAMLVNTGKYIREQNKNDTDDYDILLNSNYYINKSVVSTNKTTKFIGIVAIVISTITLVKEVFESDKIEVPQLEKINSQIQNQTILIDSLVHKMESLNNSLLVIKQDSIHKQLRR